MSRKEIYLSNEWKELDPVGRASILLVSEGVKPGSTFGSKYRFGVESVLEKVRLPYLLPEWVNNRYIFTVARDDKVLSDYISRFLKNSLTANQVHYANGIFYGIPECCIDDFVGVSLEDGRTFRRKKRVSFDELLKDYERSNGGYPEELDYRIPGVVPCKVDCHNALKVLGEYRDVLLEYDKEAGEELRLFNKRGYRILR